MAKTTIRLTESEFKDMVRQTINEALQEEGWLGDKWNQAKSAASTMVNGGNGLKQNFKNAKKNWNTQGELNSLGTLKTQLEDFVNSRGIDPETTTIAQLLGKSNRLGKITSAMRNRNASISRRGGASY